MIRAASVPRVDAQERKRHKSQSSWSSIKTHDSSHCFLPSTISPDNDTKTLTMLAHFDLRFAPIRFGSHRLLTFPIEDHRPAAFGHKAVPPETLWQVDEVLRTHDFSTSVRYLSVRSHPNEATSATIPTFVIVTDCRYHDTTVIHRVIDQIQSILSCLPIEVMIETIDDDWVANMATRPIKTIDMDVIQAWDRCCDNVVDFLRTQEQRERVGWTSIGLFRRGTSDDRLKCPATILIGSPDADDVFWEQEGYQSIAEIAGGALSVEVLYSTGWEMCNGGEDERDIGMEAYAPPLNMGASVCPYDEENGGGTLGGFFTFRHDGEECETTYGITAYHVAVDERTNLSAESDWHEPLTPQSLPKNQQMPTLASPSREDHENMKAHIASVLRRTKETLDQAVQDLQDLQDGSKGETAVLRKSWLPNQISRYKTSISSRQADQDVLDEYDIKIGTLAAASGARLLEAPRIGGNATTDTAKDRIVPWLIDWAAIKIDPKLEWSNGLQDPKRTMLRGGFKGKTRLNPMETANYYRILNPRELDCEVAFHGRTSGWELAELNCIESLLNPIYCGKGRPRGKMGELDGRYKVSTEKPGYCWSFVPRSGYKQRNPCLSGDSGSVVLLDPEVRPAHKGDNWWVGILFGHEHLSVGYMAPIENVIKDIEAVMNGEVIIPERA